MVTTLVSLVGACGPNIEVSGGGSTSTEDGGSTGGRDVSTSSLPPSPSSTGEDTESTTGGSTLEDPSTDGSSSDEGGSSSTGRPEPEGLQGYVVLRSNGIGNPTIATVQIPDGTVDVLALSNLLSLDGRHVLTRTIIDDAQQFDVYETSDLAAGPISSFPLPEGWTVPRFVGPSFVVGDRGDALERIDLDGAGVEPYAADLPTFFMSSSDGAFVHGCTSAPQPTLHRWEVEDDGFSEVWSAALDEESCPSLLGLARDGTTFLATTESFAFATCITIDPDGTALATESLPPGFNGTPRGPAPSNTALLVGESGSETLAYILESDCTVETIETREVGVAGARLDPTGVNFATYLARFDTPGVLEFGRFEALEEVMRLPTGDLGPAVSVARVELQ